MSGNDLLTNVIQNRDRHTAESCTATTRREVPEPESREKLGETVNSLRQLDLRLSGPLSEPEQNLSESEQTMSKPEQRGFRGSQR
jgi:hypothetical protein